MDNYFYKESTNILMKVDVYGTLEYDAMYFGFIKNGNPNISGFLNRLIPELSAYRDDLHERFLLFNNGDENITAAVENNIYQVYLNTFSLNDDAKINVPFRISKKYYDDFMLIQTCKLQKYRLDFTNYVRSLLEEYVIKPLFSRELFFHYRKLQALKSIIHNEQLCRIFSKEGFVEMIPIVVEPFANLGKNYIFGLDSKKEKFTYFPVYDLEQIISSNETIPLEENDFSFLFESIEEFLEAEED